MSVHNVLNGITNRVLVRSHLFGAVSIPKGEGVIFQRLEVNGDAERRAKLIIS